MENKSNGRQNIQSARNSSAGLSEIIGYIKTKRRLTSEICAGELAISLNRNTLAGGITKKQVQDILANLA